MVIKHFFICGLTNPVEPPGSERGTLVSLFWINIQDTVSGNSLTLFLLI